MKKLFIIFFSLCVSGVLAQEQPALMPWPKSINPSSGNFIINKEFSISVDGPENDEIETYISRFWNRLSSRTTIYFPAIDNQTELAQTSLQIKYNRIDEVKLDMDESYVLEILPDGVTLNSETQIGIMRGLETLLQLLKTDHSGFYFQGYKIEDSPRFVWRGLLLDVCRHWMPIEVVKRNLDGMAAVKMNVLHLHLTEDQGFRIESKTYPKLHELGSNGNYYSHEDIAEIIDYANALGIRVIPEFDIPGHTTSWFVGYPELASAPGPYSIETTFGVQDPTMDPSKETTYKFLEKFLTEMAALFNDEFVHIGGDENNGKQWDDNEEIQIFMNENGFESNHVLQAHFNSRVADILTNLDKRMIGWDEIMDPDLPKNIVIQSWRGKDALIEAAENGYEGILSNGYYIDLAQSTEYHYLNDPLPFGNRIRNDVARNVLGGEATMWSEVVSPETVDSRIWPRTAAIAERFWSPGSIRDVNSMYTRLASLSIQLEEHGLSHIKGPEMLSRRLVGEDNVILLNNLMQYVEPIEGYQRKKPSTNMPLTRAPDIAAPDAMKARDFNLRVDDYIKNKDAGLRDDIKDQLLLWVENDKDLKRLAKDKYVVREFLPLSSDLSRIAIVGLQSLSETVTHDGDWKSKAEKTLSAAESPKAECEIKVISGIRKLVQATK